MENKTKVINMVASALAGVIVGMFIMYAIPVQNNIDASVTATQQAVVAASKVKSGVVYELNQDSFSIYTTQGTKHKIAVNEKTQFSEILKSGGATTVKAFSDLNINYYALIVTTDQDPNVAASVIFKAFTTAPFSFISATSTTPTTTPAPTGTTTTPASTSTGTTAAPTGTTSTSTTSASTSTTTTAAPSTTTTPSATNVAPSGATSTSTSDMTAAPTGSTTTPEATSSATTLAPSAGTSSDMTSVPTTPDTTAAQTGTTMTPAPSN